MVQNIFIAILNRDYSTLVQLLKNRKAIIQYNSDGIFPLYLATTENDTIAVKLLLEAGVDINQRVQRPPINISCLEYACMEGFVEIVKILIENGADINQKGYLDFSPLRVASGNGKLKIVEYLVSKGAEIDSKGEDEGISLEVAAAKGYLDIVTYLVEVGADINNQDWMLDTPLAEACKYGQLDVVKFLIEKGADSSLTNMYRETLLSIAITEGQNKIVEYLIQHEINLEDKLPDGIKRNFKYVTSIIDYLEKENEFNSLEKILELNPRYRLGLVHNSRIKAYTVLQWAMKNPKADFKSIDYWRFQDNSEYFLKMKRLYDFMTEHKIFEENKLLGVCDISTIEDKEQFLIGVRYITEIINLWEKKYKLENVHAFKEFKQKDNLGFTQEIYQKALNTLEWIIKNPNVDFRKFDPEYIDDNQIYFTKMKTVYDIIKKYNMNIVTNSEFDL